MTDERDTDRPGGQTGQQRDDELWRKIDSEAEMLRKRTTPAYLKQQIMDALPEEPPRPWYERLFKRG